MRNQGLNLEQTKQANRLLVLRLICTIGNVTRTELTRRVGLAKMTVSNITADLLRTGMIQEAEPSCEERPTAGRPQTVLHLSREAPAVAGIWISRDLCVGIACTMDLQVLGQFQVELGVGDTAETLLEKLERTANELKKAAARPVMGLGLASIGPLDLERGLLLNPPNFYGIREVSLTETLSARLELPVFLQNDMDAAALAEKLYGQWAALKNFAYVGLSNGIGAGLVMGDSLFTGQHGFAGEIGHMVVNCEGPVCTCGNRGCLETYVSVPKIRQCFQQEFQREFSGFEEICQFSRENTQASLLMDKLTDKLAVALASFCNLMDPEAVVLGHDGAFLSNSQLALLEKRINDQILSASFTHVRVLRSSFGAMAPSYGAAVVALKRVFDGKLWYEKIF